MLHAFVSVYVPSTRHAHKITRAEHKNAVKRVAGEFSRILGGATAYPAFGYWQSESAGLIEESVTIVRSYYAPEFAEQAIGACRLLAAELRQELEQEAVTIETNEGIEFI